MKKRTTIIAILLVAALALGIGYASLTSDLVISSKLIFSESEAEAELDADVYFTEANGDNVYCTAYLDQSASTNNKPDVAHLQIGGDQVSLELATPQHTAVATFTVRNDYDSTVQINPTPTFSASPSKVEALYKIDVEVTVDGTETLDIPGNGGIATVTVSITPENVISEQLIDEDFSIALNPSVLVNP